MIVPSPGGQFQPRQPHIEPEEHPAVPAGAGDCAGDGGQRFVGPALPVEAVGVGQQPRLELHADRRGPFAHQLRGPLAGRAHEQARQGVDEGQEGLELAFDQWLSGEAGAKRVIKDGRRDIVENVENIRSARPGKNLTLSIDRRIQYLAYRELKRAVAKHKAKSASAVVIDVASGEILAMVNQPAYNPNGTLAGAGMGFLWFNAYPAQIFMGDVGSLSLGASLGTIAVITKQEILLLLVGGLFVMEALSVIFQVGFFKMTRGKRIFRMAPLHHHFELKGWPEPKVIVRFWIIAILAVEPPLLGFGCFADGGVNVG